MFEDLGLDVDREHIDQNKIMAKDDQEVFTAHVPSMGSNHGIVKCRELKAAEQHMDVEDIPWLGVTSGKSWETLDVDVWGLIETLDRMDNIGQRLFA
ncbi:hypothetical protein [Natrarchaeobaculum sulfurireducens]|nr:hypothetical protein [Natrarchaeobaculum sulfurireducens]